MDAKQLPARPNLEQFRKQAKDLLDQFRSPEALQRFRTFQPRLKGLTESELAATRPSLADAQHVIAREHGFESWPKFAKHIRELVQVGSPVSKFESAADAIVRGDLAALKNLLRENPDLIGARSTRAHGAPLIHYVAANGIENFRQKTPKNIVEISKVLLHAGVDVDATTSAYGSASTALGLAATSYHPAKAGVQLDLLNTLLEAGACVNGAPGGWNPVVAALHNGRGDAATFLAERGASLDVESAAGTGRVEILSRYINEDGTLKPGSSREQVNYGFMWACEYGHVSVVRFLLDHGVAPDTSLTHGETGLHWSAYGGNAEIVDVLLRAHASVNCKEQRHGGTPLGWALYGWNDPAPEFRDAHYYETVEHLVRAGAFLDREWTQSPNRGSSIAARIQADPRMKAALRIES